MNQVSGAELVSYTFRLSSRGGLTDAGHEILAKTTWRIRNVNLDAKQINCYQFDSFQTKIDMYLYWYKLPQGRQYAAGNSHVIRTLGSLVQDTATPGIPIKVSPKSNFWCWHWNTWFTTNWFRTLKQLWCSKSSAPKFTSVEFWSLKQLLSTFIYQIFTYSFRSIKTLLLM